MRVDILSIVVPVDEAEACFDIEPLYFANYLRFWVVFVRRIFFNRKVNKSVCACESYYCE